MSSRASVFATGAVKRPCSSYQDDSAGWESDPPRTMPMPSSLDYPHYALIVLDDMGKLNTWESRSIRDQDDTLFNPDVKERFLEIVRRSSGVGAYRYAHGHADDFSRHTKRRKASIKDPALDMHFPGQYSDSVEEFSQYPSTNMVGIKIGDTEKVVKYYENAFEHFQQLNCRQIAKAFIKVVEPRKQAKHPYKGEKGDSEKTKPKWWPVGVVHKEPDHLRKEQRIRLLIHIVRKLGHLDITADKLQEAAYDSKRLLNPTAKIKVLEELFKVRRIEEKYERKEIDATTMVYVVDWAANPKEENDSEPVRRPERKVDVEEGYEGFLHPASSARQILFASVDMTMGATPESRSGNDSPATPTTLSPSGPTDHCNYSHPTAFTAMAQLEGGQHPAAMSVQPSVRHYDFWAPSRQIVSTPDNGMEPSPFHFWGPYPRAMPAPSDYVDTTHGLPPTSMPQAIRMGPIQ